jgi:hypothetical protein
METEEDARFQTKRSVATEEKTSGCSRELMPTSVQPPTPLGRIVQPLCIPRRFPMKSTPFQTPFSLHPVPKQPRPRESLGLPPAIFCGNDIPLQEAGATSVELPRRRALVLPF